MADNRTPAELAAAKAAQQRAHDAKTMDHAAYREKHGCVAVAPGYKADGTKAAAATKIVVFPNPNNDEETGYKNCWTCDHAGPQEPKENSSLILCEACGDLLDVPGAQVVDESGKPVQWGKSNPDGTLRAAGAGQ
jgi:hypothetical protein